MDCFKRYVNEKMMTLALAIYTRLFKNRMDRSDIRLPVELRMPSIQLLGVLFNGVLVPVISIVFLNQSKSLLQRSFRESRVSSSLRRKE